MIIWEVGTDWNSLIDTLHGNRRYFNDLCCFTPPLRHRLVRNTQKEIDMIFHVDFFMPVGLQKAALSNSPVDCCNQPGFPQKSESNRGLRIDALFIFHYFSEKFVFKLK